MNDSKRFEGFLEDLLKSAMGGTQKIGEDILKSMAREHEKKVDCGCFVCSSLRIVDVMIENEYSRKSRILNVLTNDMPDVGMIEISEKDMKAKRLELHEAFVNYSSARTLYKTYSARGERK
jgi:hypothetical protein